MDVARARGKRGGHLTSGHKVRRPLTHGQASAWRVIATTAATASRTGWPTGSRSTTSPWKQPHHGDNLGRLVDQAAATELHNVRARGTPGRALQAALSHSPARPRLAFARAVRCSQAHGATRVGRSLRDARPDRPGRCRTGRIGRGESLAFAGLGECRSATCGCEQCTRCVHGEGAGCSRSAAAGFARCVTPARCCCCATGAARLACNFQNQTIRETARGFGAKAHQRAQRRLHLAMRAGRRGTVRAAE